MKITRLDTKSLAKVINTAMEVATKKGKEMGDNVIVTMTESDAASRFSSLDGEKYGKMSINQSCHGRVIFRRNYS